jgi:hypothetical protein
MSFLGTPIVAVKRRTSDELDVDAASRTETEGEMPIFPRYAVPVNLMRKEGNKDKPESRKTAIRSGPKSMDS